MRYHPDKWLVIKFEIQEQFIYKVFAVWYGGYTGSDSWQINSGIMRVTQDDEFFYFEGYSGSVYVCRKKQYGTNLYGQSVLNNIIEKNKGAGCTVTVLEEQDFTEIEYPL